MAVAGFHRLNKLGDRLALVAPWLVVGFELKRHRPNMLQTRAAHNRRLELLCSGGEDRLKVRALFFSRNNRHFDAAKASFF